MFSSSGILTYGPGIRAAISVDSGIIEFYRSLIPKYYSIASQMYSGHITVVRTGKESPTDLTAWGKYQGEKIFFQYSPEIHWDGTYWFLNVWSPRIGEIRKELGLPEYRNIKDCYHISLGNSKTKKNLKEVEKNDH